MKKTLLLSVVASTMIMAGGDIAPVEPVVEEAPVAEALGVTIDKVSGYAKLWYETNDGTDFFDQDSSSGEAVLSVKVEGKAGPLGYGVRYTAADTLGLENDVVSSRRVLSKDGNGLETVSWFEEAYITYAMGNTTAKIGRQHLDTPFAFTEKWNAVANSFDAAVIMNNDIDNVTLVAAYVGKSNGGAFGNGTGTVRKDGAFKPFGGNVYTTQAAGNVHLDGDGAYAFAALTKPMDNLAINGWYYNVPDIADAYWIDATFDAGVAKVTGIYAGMNPKGNNDDVNPGDLPDTDGWAAKVAGSVADFNLMAAYSSVDEDGVLPLANVATGFKKTKLPTAGVYTDGIYVAQPGADSWKVKAATTFAGVSFAAQYVSCDNDTYASGNSDEFDFIVGGKIADLDVKAIYINREFGADDTDMEHIRLITTFKF